MCAKLAAREKHRERAQDQVQMLGVRDQRQEDQQRQRVRPPQRLGIAVPEGRQIRDHQHEDQQRDDAGFGRNFRPASCGRTKKRRTKSPAIEIATATANAAAK